MDMERAGQVIGRILEDYKQDRDIDRMGQAKEPDKDEIIVLIGKLRRIVFPGYFQDKNYRTFRQGSDLQAAVEDAMIGMGKQLQRSYQSAGTPESEAKVLAKEVCLQFFDSIPKVRALVQTDLQAAYDGDPAATGMAEIIFAYPGLFAITGVTLGGLSTRGGQSLRGKRRHPTIGDNVTIYANASILGGETVIGHDCVIGASAFITESVPPCTTVRLKNQELSLKSKKDCC